MKPRLYYIGDLPPYRVDGITLSFQRCISILATYFSIHNVPELSHLKPTLPQKIVSTFRFWYATKKAFKNISPSVVYMNYAVTFLGTLKILGVMILGKKYQAKIVLHIHRGDFISKYLKVFANKRLAEVLVKRASRILVLSTNDANSLNSLFDTDKFTFLPNTIEKEHHIEKGVTQENRLIFLSNYLEDKGIVDLLNVVRDLNQEGRNIRLDCYGSFPNEKMKKTLLTYQSKNIKINEGIYGSEKYLAISKASCLILPSHNEGMPLCILEAMSLGIPVIASDVGYIREMLGSGYPYVYSSKERLGLKRSIETFLKDSNQEVLSGSLRTRYQTHYSQEIHKNALLAQFKPLLN